MHDFFNEFFHFISSLVILGHLVIFSSLPVFGNELPNYFSEQFLVCGSFQSSLLQLCLRFKMWAVLVWHIGHLVLFLFPKRMDIFLVITFQVQKLANSHIKFTFCQYPRQKKKKSFNNILVTKSFYSISPDIGLHRGIKIIGPDSLIELQVCICRKCWQYPHSSVFDYPSSDHSLVLSPKGCIGRTCLWISDESKGLVSKKHLQVLDV